MVQHRKIVVRGKQKRQIDAQLLVQLLVAIGRDVATEQPPASPDTFEAAIEDRGGAA